MKRCVQRVRVMVCIWSVCMVEYTVPGFDGVRGEWKIPIQEIVGL